MLILSPNHITMKRIILFFVAAITLAACTNYGKKVKSGNIEMYYREGITEDEAQKTASEIEKLDDSKEKVRKSFQLLRDGDTVTLRMVVDEAKAKDMGDEAFLGIAQIVSQKVFGDRPVNMDLTGKTFKTIKHISYKKPVTEDPSNEANVTAFGPKLKEGNIEVYMKGSTEDEAAAVATYMQSYFKPETTFSYQLVKDEAGNYTVKMVGNPDYMDKFTPAFFTTICKGVCDALHVPAVRMEMTDIKFSPMKSFNYPEDTGNSDLQN